MKIKLIENWRDAYKMFSVQAFALIGFLMGIQQAWDSIPDVVKAFIPQEYIGKITLFLAIVGAIARLVQQFFPKPTEGEQDAAN